MKLVNVVLIRTVWKVSSVSRELNAFQYDDYMALLSMSKPGKLPQFCSENIMLCLQLSKQACHTLYSKISDRDSISFI